MYLHTQLFPFEDICSIKPVDRDIMLITAIGVENILTFMGDQKLCGYDLSFVNVLFILKIDVSFPESG